MMAPAPPGSLEVQCWQQLITQLRSAAGLPDLPGTAPAAPPIPQDDDALWTYVHDTWGVAIPHVPKRGVTRAPGPHPYKASHRHQYWFIDGRMMDFALNGVRWWSLIILEGYSRTMLAGAIAPTEATWAALMVLYTACLRYGVPGTLVSDSGGAYTSNDFEAVCTRLQVQHVTIVSTQGESYQNLMETHFNIQRRVYDYQFSLARSPMELEQRHQAFIQTYNTTAHQGLLQDQRLPPMPVEVLGAAKGRIYAEDELAHGFSQALFPRTTNRHGCVTLHSYHFYVEAWFTPDTSAAVGGWRAIAGRV